MVFIVKLATGVYYYLILLNTALIRVRAANLRANLFDEICNEQQDREDHTRGDFSPSESCTP